MYNHQQQTVNIDEESSLFLQQQGKMITDIINHVMQETSDPDSIKMMFTFKTIKLLPKFKTPMQTNKLSQFDITFTLNTQKSNNFKVVCDYLNMCLTQNIHKKLMNNKIEEEDRKSVTFYTNTLNACKIMTTGILLGLSPDFYGRNTSSIQKIHHSY